MKAMFISFAIAIVLYGILSYIAVIVKKPIFCSNIFMIFLFLGLALRNFFEAGISGVDESIMLFLLLLFFSLIVFIVSGLKYSIGLDMDMLKKELVSLKFTPEGQSEGKKVHKFFTSNGTKVIAKQYPHNKLIDISLVNGLRFKKINAVRTAILPILKKYTANTNFKLNSIMIIMLGLVFFFIYLIL